MVANSLSYSFSLDLTTLLFFSFSTLFSPFIEASALPSLTKFTNTSSVSATGPTVTGCTPNCTRYPTILNYISWSQMSITATYTVETILLVINDRTNSTRTSTIKNTEIDFANISIPTNTNSAGTVTTSISFFNGDTTIATFPTIPFEDYASTYAVCGTLPTVISGTSTCLTIPIESCSNFGNSTSSLNSNNGVFTFPSHPPLPVGVQTNVDLSLDPRGWTYVATVEQICDGQYLLQPLFPDLSFWSCGGPLTCLGGNNFLQTALYLTATTTSHEADNTLSNAKGTILIGPYALTPTTNLVSPILSQPTQGTASVLEQDHQSHPPASDNSPMPAQLGSIGSPTGLQPTSTDQPAQDRHPTPNDNPPSPISISPNTISELDNEPALNSRPAPKNQQTSSPWPVPIQPAQNPPSPQSATIVPIAVASTNAQGSVVVSTTLAAAIAVLQTSINNQKQPSVFATFSPLTADAPVTLIPQAVTSTNAQGSVILATSNVVPVPVVTTFTNPQGKVIITTPTKLSPVALNPTASPIALIPTSITATNAQGVTTVTAGTAAIIPIVASSTNSQGQIVLSSSLLTAAATASTSIVISLTNAQGGITSSTTEVPAVIFTTTNGQGSQILTTLPILPISVASTTPPIITIGTQTIILNSQSQYIIDSQTLTPGGAITVSGTPISLAPSATALVIGTSTQRLGIAATTLPTLTIGTLTVSPNSLSQYIVSSQTLTPGGIITLSGTPISLGPSATALVIGSNTIPLGSSTILPPPLTFGSQVFTANSATQYIIGSQTLTPGGVITVSGTRISLAPGDTAAVVGTSTEGLAALITAGLGSGLGNGNGNGNGTALFTGAARASGISNLAVWLEGVLLLLGFGIVVGL